MPDPITPINQYDARIPRLPALPASTDRSKLLVPVFDPNSDTTYQTALAVNGEAIATSNALAGGPKYVRYRSSQLYGLTPADLTLDSLDPGSILPGTEAVVLNPADNPTQQTAPPKRYVATLATAGDPGAVSVPATTGGQDRVFITWQEADETASEYTPLLASELDKDKAAYANLGLRPLLLKLVNALNTATSTTVLTPVAAVPSPAPTVTGFLPDSAAVGASVTLTGTNFTKATAVTFNGTTASFQPLNATTIVAVVPVGATTGTVSVVSQAGTGTSTASFTVVASSSSGGGSTPTPQLTAALALSLAQITLGASVGYSITASGGTAPYSYQVTATDVSTGATFDLGTTKSGTWQPPAVDQYAIDAVVTDAAGKMVETATRYLNVVPAANRIPVGDAGNDATVQLPTSAIALMGRATDPDNDAIATHAWRQITGPNSATGLPASTQNVVASNLVAGVYQFGYVATDSRGGQSAEDYVLVTVQPAPTNGKIGVLAMGNSLQYGALLSDPATQAFSPQLLALLPSNYTLIANTGQSGKSIQYLWDNRETLIGQYLTADYFATYGRILVLGMEAVNGLGDGSVSLQQYKDLWTQLAAYITAKGGELIIESGSPCYNAERYQPYNPGTITTQSLEDQRRYLNDWFYANWKTIGCLGILDVGRLVAGMSTVADASSTTYFIDGQHPNQAGYYKWAAFAASLIVKMVAGTFTFTAPAPYVPSTTPPPSTSIPWTRVSANAGDVATDANGLVTNTGAKNGDFRHQALANYKLLGGGVGQIAIRVGGTNAGGVCLVVGTTAQYFTSTHSGIFKTAPGTTGDYGIQNSTKAAGSTFGGASAPAGITDSCYYIMDIYLDANNVRRARAMWATDLTATPTFLISYGDLSFDDSTEYRLELVVEDTLNDVQCKGNFGAV